MNRDELLDRLSRCSPGIFRKVVYYLKLPPGVLSSDTSDQATRATQLIEWAEHPDGPGVEKLEKCYQKAIGEVLAKPDNIEELKPKAKLQKTQHREVNNYSQIQNQLAFSLSSLPKVYLLTLIFVVTVMLTYSVQGIRSLGWLQGAELYAFDWLMRLRPLNEPDPRILVITVNKDDMEYQDRNAMDRKEGWSLADKALIKVLHKLKPYQPTVIGLNIAHHYKFDPELEDILKKSGNFIASCEIGSIDTPKEDTLPPPGIPTERLGFSDLTLDSSRNKTIRRQLLLMAAGKDCNTSRAFSLQIAHKYLEQRGIPPIKKLPDGRRKLGEHTIKKLEYNTGGYQLPPSEDNGYQILLNYRYADPETTSLKEVLNGSLDFKLPELAKNRIIIIGVDQSQQDRNRTVYYNGNLLSEKPGIIVNAHMISQILDLVEKDKPLLWWLPEWGEAIWISMWSVWGIWLALKFCKPIHFGFAIPITLIALCGLCFVLLLFEGWVPLVPSVIAVLVAVGGRWFISSILVKIVKTFNI